MRTSPKVTRRFAASGCAALTGRTPCEGWGRIFFVVLGSVLSTAVGPGSAQAFDLPSGQDAALQESFYEAQENGELWARFRFVMPGLAQGLTYGDVEADFMTLCSDYALPSMQGAQIPSQIIISLASAETEFGLPNADVTQFFEAFHVKNEACMWGEF